MRHTHKEFVCLEGSQTEKKNTGLTKTPQKKYKYKRSGEVATFKKNNPQIWTKMELSSGGERMQYLNFWTMCDIKIHRVNDTTSHDYVVGYHANLNTNIHTSSRSGELFERSSRQSFLFFASRIGANARHLKVALDLNQAQKTDLWDAVVTAI